MTVWVAENHHTHELHLFSDEKKAVAFIILRSKDFTRPWCERGFQLTPRIVDEEAAP